MSQAASGAEWPRPVRLDMLGDRPQAMAIEAEAGERDALARRFGLVALPAVSAEAELARHGDRVDVSGRLTAAVVQACVATGVDVPATIDERFTLRFVPEREVGEDLELDEGDLDEIAYAGGSVDLGEAVAQTLALALDPFPRSPNADTALRAAGVVPEEEAGGSSGLKGLRDLLKK